MTTDLRIIARDYDPEPLEAFLAFVAAGRALLYLVTWSAELFGATTMSTFGSSTAYSVLALVPEWFWVLWLGTGSALVGVGLLRRGTRRRQWGHVLLFAVNGWSCVAFAVSNPFSGAWMAALGWTLGHAWCLYRSAEPGAT